MENYMKVILFVRQVTHELVDFNYNGFRDYTSHLLCLPLLEVE